MSACLTIRPSCWSTARLLAGFALEFRFLLDINIVARDGDGVFAGLDLYVLVLVLMRSNLGVHTVDPKVLFHGLVHLLVDLVRLLGFNVGFYGFAGCTPWFVTHARGGKVVDELLPDLFGLALASLDALLLLFELSGGLSRKLVKQSLFGLDRSVSEARCGDEGDVRGLTALASRSWTWRMMAPLASPLTS